MISRDRIPDKVLKGIFLKKLKREFSFRAGVFPPETNDPFWEI
jgi:hypothetical protein